MGWGARTLAVLLGIIAFGVGAWPITLLAIAYFAYSFRRRVGHRTTTLSEEILPKAKRPLGSYLLGGGSFLVALVAIAEGGRLSPVVFLTAGLVAVSWPVLKGKWTSSGVAPVHGSILLRSRTVPFLWHALAEVKLEPGDQSRGLAALEGKVLVFAGRSPSAFKVVTAYALNYKSAEESVVMSLQRETKILSQRGAHLLPLDSTAACEKLALGLGRLSIGAGDFGAVSSLPFDVLALRTKGGLVTGYRAFRIRESRRSASIPVADIPLERQPLFAEVVDVIGEKNGWPQPDDFSAFLAAMDASRAEPLADRIKARGGKDGKLAVEAPGGAGVALTRSQLRAVMRAYS